MDEEIKKLFKEIMTNYEKAERKNLEGILQYSHNGYDRQMERLKNEITEYENRLEELLKRIKN